MPERLQKIVAQWGLASRRKAEKWIQEGRIVVNGAVAHLGQQVDPDCDRITIDGKPLCQIQRPNHHYILVHKPVGVVCTCHDPQHRSIILDLLPPQLRQGQGLHIVGRLDTDSTGAVLITNDGDLTFALTHPRHHVSKTYHVWVQGHPTQTTLQAWRQGILLSGRRTLPARVRLLQQTAGQSLLEVVLQEGRNRQIRRVAESLNHPVVGLHRIAIGTVHLAHLPPGHHRLLTKREVDALHSLIGASRA